ncbi:MAG: glycosyl transferase family 2 [Planctomycetota bacterium]|nr:MAG: glycosyl transferase family 2 [Planctomycetota bacterium]
MCLRGSVPFFNRLLCGPMNVSVIIPALDEAARIRESIDRAWVAGADEVIVVDGGSRDGTADIAAAARCELVASRRGRARQQNAGAARATGGVLLFLHADNWLAAGAVDQVRRVLGDSRGAWGAFRQRIEAAGIGYRLLELSNWLRAACVRRPYGDQGIFVRRAAFEAVGGFPDVPLMEDVLLAKRLAALGRPRLLRGPLYVSARRWQARGVVRQTLQNWSLLARARLGARLDELAAEYEGRE